MKNSKGETINTWEDGYFVSFYEVDANNRIFLAIPRKYLQEIAQNHAYQIRIGYLGLAQHDFSWVLSRLTYDDQKRGWSRGLPRQGEAEEDGLE